MLAPGKSMQADLHATSPPVRLDHLFFTCRFCLQRFVPLPSAVFSYVQTPSKPQFQAAEEIYSCRREKKKLIELSLKYCRTCWHGPAP